ncbi:unnamed protein product [Cylindrotheca closterium]|uniref:Uncharacterized protein n=1 Tax=Cylindrotheca closterium TaxID=2856 RepID=A0AAD2FRB3_9STRA|nr:unnamed protein product [Cylindrotheca closterium]
MIESNTNPENKSHSALQDFMTNVLQVQKHPQLSVVEDNAKSPTRRKQGNKKAAPILQFTTDLKESQLRWPVDHKASASIKSKKEMDRWGDMHFEPLQRKLREEQQTKRNETCKVASNHRFNASRFNDRPLPSSVIGNGHVALLRQNSLERHFLAVAAEEEREQEEEDEAEEEHLPTVPEDESVHAPHVVLTSPKRKRQRHHMQKKITHKMETESKADVQDKASKGTPKPHKSDAAKKQSKPRTE